MEFLLYPCLIVYHGVMFVNRLYDLLVSPESAVLMFSAFTGGKSKKILDLVKTVNCLVHTQTLAEGKTVSV